MQGINLTSTISVVVRQCEELAHGLPILTYEGEPVPDARDDTVHVTTTVGVISRWPVMHE